VHNEPAAVQPAENLRLSASSLDAATEGAQIAQDSFQTRNQFYGGQLGARLELTFGRLSAELTALAALGQSHEVLSINGDTTITDGAFGHPTGTAFMPSRATLAASAGRSSA
jgi:hypothetical protein